MKIIIFKLLCDILKKFIDQIQIQKLKYFYLILNDK